MFYSFVRTLISIRDILVYTCVECSSNCGKSAVNFDTKSLMTTDIKCEVMQKQAFSLSSKLNSYLFICLNRISKSETTDFFLQWMESKLNRLCVCNLTIGCRSSKLMRQTGIYFRPPNFPKMFPIFWVDICSSHFSISWMHSWVLHQVSSPLWPRISRVPSKEAACATWIIVNARYMANKPGK